MLIKQYARYVAVNKETLVCYGATINVDLYIHLITGVLEKKKMCCVLLDS